jgi:23S rRNA (guanosine2251-2'-O)-methyltransferase
LQALTDLIAGRNPTLEALKSGRYISRIQIVRDSDQHGPLAEIASLAKARAVPLEFVEKTALDRLANGENHQGVLAFTARREYLELDRALLIPAQRKQPAFLVLLDGVEDPHNLGAILRTAEATGVHAVVVRERRAVGLTAGVEKASAGALEYLAVSRVVNLTQTIRLLKERNIWVVGVDQAGPSGYTSVDYRPDTALVIGGEGQGLTDLVRKNCDFVVSIPMLGKINSLNASVAAAVVLYEVVRQRSG